MYRYRIVAIGGGTNLNKVVSATHCTNLAEECLCVHLHTGKKFVYTSF